MHMHNIIAVRPRGEPKAVGWGTVFSFWNHLIVIILFCTFSFLMHQSIVAFMWYIPALIVHYSLQDNVKVKFYV